MHSASGWRCGDALGGRARPRSRKTPRPLRSCSRFAASRAFRGKRFARFSRSTTRTTRSSSALPTPTTRSPRSSAAQSPPIPSDPARLLIGDDRVSANPKLNNVVKGWKAARHDWVIIADSNVLMPPDYIQRLLKRWRPNTGHRLRASDRLAAGVVRRGDRMRLPQHLRGALAICGGGRRLRFRAGQDDALAARHPRSGRRHRSSGRRDRRGRGVDETGPRPGS